MLEKGIEKVKRSNNFKYRIISAHALSESIPAPSNSYDSVVDTFGLCSVRDPVKALEEMKRVVKPNGLILLLEHGKSSNYTWINNALDKTTCDHAKRWGCFWNRDIKDIILKAGLEPSQISTHHFGTTQAIIIECNKI